MRTCLLALLISLTMACTVNSHINSSRTKGDDTSTTSPVGSESGSSSDESDTSTSVNSTNLAAPPNLSAAERSDSLSDAPTLDWDPVEEAASYEVAIGTTPGGTDVLGWTSIGSATTYAASSLSLQNGEVYYASVRAVAADGTKGSISTGNGWQNLVCPAGYIKVPGNETPSLGGSVYLEGTKSNYDWSSDPTMATAREISDFCVMKYEAKDGGSHTAVSVATGLPWNWIPRQSAGLDNDAEEACENNGSGYPAYQLMGNHHWQAIARNIESVSENFDTSGAVTDHMFNHGHADSGPNNTLAADADDTNGCFGVTSNGDPADDCGGMWHINKRTHTLSNGEVIWDLAGNVSEWVRDNNTSLQGSDAYMQTVPYSDALKWGPDLDYSAQTGARRAGLGAGQLNEDNGAVLRGGNYFNLMSSGIFFASMDYFLVNNNAFIGFRCVYAP